MIVEDNRVSSLMEEVHKRNQEIQQLQTQLTDVFYKYHVNENDNLSLKRLVSDLQHHFESTIRSRELEIERLTARVMYLEEELFLLNKRPKWISGTNKDSFDPEKLRQLERTIKDREDEIEILKQDIRLLHDKQDMNQKQALARERKRIINEADHMNLPFLVENDKLKKEISQLKIKLEKFQSDLDFKETEIYDLNQEIERLKRKLREHEQVVQLRQENEEEFKKQLQPVYVKVSEDQQLLDGLLGLIHYVRESICDVIFEVFIRSANQAHTKKLSSSIIFSINVKELKERNLQGFVIVLYLYKRMKQFIKIYFPYYGKVSLTDEIAKITLGAKTANEPCHFRDDINQWLEKNVNMVMLQQKQGAKRDKDHLYFHLYRLLALRYRIKYPMNNERPHKLDLDIRVRLENKICIAMLRMFIEE